MTKSKKFLLLPLIVGSALLTTLVGCGESLPKLVEGPGTGYKYGRDIFFDVNKNNQEYNYVTKKKDGQAMMPTRGKSKMLVVPVLYKGSTKTAAHMEQNRETCRRAFFGKPEETYWHSVNSYFKQVSYGLLDIQGEVSPAVTLPQDHGYYASKGSSSTNSILESAYNALFKEVDGKAPLYNWEDYDSNGDGLVDSIYLVHEAPLGEEFDWAFTTWHRNGFKKYPHLGAYCWSSIDFATRGIGSTANLPDGHTFIHETGHLMGLNDYYDYYNKNQSPAGGCIMQDNNICDHDPFSKYLYGWTTPTIVTDENKEDTIEIELKPFESSGDTLLLASGFNDTSLDEYLLIEYYTPTGINKFDSEVKYEACEGLTEKGLKIWHCDKRVYESYLHEEGSGIDRTVTTYFNPNASEDPDVKGLVDKPDTDGKEYYAIFSTNTSEHYGGENFYITPELQLLRKRTMKPGENEMSLAVNDDMWFEGETFGAKGDKFENFEFYDTIEDVDYDCTVDQWNAAAKRKLPYSLKVESLGDTAKIVLTKLAA